MWSVFDCGENLSLNFLKYINLLFICKFIIFFFLLKALGNLYFIHKHIKHVRMWNFLTRNWENTDGKGIYSGNIETISSKEKSKFPQHFFPEVFCLMCCIIFEYYTNKLFQCKWSRKGYMRTRWEVNRSVFDLVNIHLFHDASNLAACEEFPSVYCKTRRRALVHTLER